MPRTHANSSSDAYRARLPAPCSSSYPNTPCWHIVRRPRSVGGHTRAQVAAAPRSRQMLSFTELLPYSDTNGARVTPVSRRRPPPMVPWYSCTSTPSAAPEPARQNREGSTARRTAAGAGMTPPRATVRCGAVAPRCSSVSRCRLSRSQEGPSRASGIAFASAGSTSPPPSPAPPSPAPRAASAAATRPFATNVHSGSLCAQ